MEKIKIIFQGEVTEILAPKNIIHLQEEISKKIPLSLIQAKGIKIYYINPEEKIFIKSQVDYQEFLSSRTTNIKELFLETIISENSDDKKSLSDLLEMQNEYKKMKINILNSHFQEIDDITEQIRVLSRKKFLLMKENDKQIKIIDSLLNNNEKQIHQIQQKLGILKSTNKNKLKKNFIYNLIPQKSKNETFPVANDIPKEANKVLCNTVQNIKNEVLSEDGKNEKIEKIRQFAKDTVKEINNLTKIIIDQSEEMISKINQEKNISFNKNAERSKVCWICGMDFNNEAIRFKCVICNEVYFYAKFE